MGHSGLAGEGKHRSLGGRGGGLSSSSGGGDIDFAGEEGSESSFNSSSQTRERNLQRRLILRKWYEEATVRVEYLKSVDCFGWGPGITEF